MASRSERREEQDQPPVERIEPQARRQHRKATGSISKAQRPRSTRQSRTEPARPGRAPGASRASAPNGASKLSGSTKKYASRRGTQVASQTDLRRHGREGEAPERPHQSVARPAASDRHGMHAREAAQPRQADDRPGRRSPPVPRRDRPGQADRADARQHEDRGVREPDDRRPAGRQPGRPAGVNGFEADRQGRPGGRPGRRRRRSSIA